MGRDRSDWLANDTPLSISGGRDERWEGHRRYRHVCRTTRPQVHPAMLRLEPRSQPIISRPAIGPFPQGDSPVRCACLGVAAVRDGDGGRGTPQQGGHGFPVVREASAGGWGGGTVPRAEETGDAERSTVLAHEGRDNEEGEEVEVDDVCLLVSLPKSVINIKELDLVERYPPSPSVSPRVGTWSSLNILWDMTAADAVSRNPRTVWGFSIESWPST